MTHTALGQAELKTYMEVKKADGRTFYYRVENGDNVEISAEEYRQAHETPTNNSNDQET